MIDPLNSALSILDNIMSQCTGFLWIATRKTYLGTTEAALVRDKYKQFESSHGVSVTGLSVNLRSSANITNICNSNSVQDSSTYDKQSYAAPVDTISSVPVFVLFSDNTPDYLRQALNKAFTLLHISPLKQNTEDSVVIIVDNMASFSSADIQNCLSNSCSAVLSYTRHAGGDSTAVLRYLSNPAGVLITDRDAFSGMEARDVVWVGDRIGSYDRESLLRAVVNLTIITTDESAYKELSDAGCMSGGKFKPTAPRAPPPTLQLSTSSTAPTTLPPQPPRQTTHPLYKNNECRPFQQKWTWFMR